MLASEIEAELVSAVSRAHGWTTKLCALLCSEVDSSQCLLSDRRFMTGKLIPTRKSSLQELPPGETVKVRRVHFSWRPGKASGWDVGFCIYSYIYKRCFLFSVFPACLRIFFLKLCWADWPFLGSLFLSLAYFIVDIMRNKGVSWQLL